MFRSTATSPSIPSLTLAYTQPHLHRHGNEALVFLRRIERIEISEVREIYGVIYYVMDVYVAEITSRIPTLIQRKYAALNDGTKSNCTTAREPDYRILRRFSDFEKLKGLIDRFIGREQRNDCTTCKKWVTASSIGLSQPHFFMKWVKSPEVRKNMLGKFIKSTLQLALETLSTTCERRTQSCGLRETVAPILQLFIHNTAQWKKLCQHYY